MRSLNSFFLSYKIISVRLSVVNGKHKSLLYSLLGLYLYSSEILISTGIEYIKFKFLQLLISNSSFPFSVKILYSIIGILKSSVVYSILNNINDSLFESKSLDFLSIFSQSWKSMKVRLSILILLENSENW